MLETINSLGHGGQGIPDLAKVISELQGLTISGPLTGAGASVAIAVPNIEHTDTVLKCLELVDGVPEDRTADTTIVDRRATGTLTLTDVIAGNTAVVRGVTYTAVTFTRTPSNGMPPPRSFAVGASDTLTAANLAAAILANDPLLIATSAGAVVTVTARAPGTGGNAYALVGTTDKITRSAANLAGGTATNAIKIADATTGNLVLLFWYKKSRTLGQA